jgi:NitT/TauT family transport system permease protein
LCRKKPEFIINSIKYIISDLWFGLGFKPILFVTVIGSLAVYILSIMNGFNTIPAILIDVGKIYGLRKWRLIRHIYFPAALPGIITGLKAAWGISWRSLVAAELVYGAMGRSAGIGWLITINRYHLNPDGMAVGILVIVAIGLAIEHLVVGTVERKTVEKWGMKR